MLKFKMVCWSNCVAYEDSEITHEFESIDVITAEDYAESYIHKHEYVDVGCGYHLFVLRSTDSWELVDCTDFIPDCKIDPDFKDVIVGDLVYWMMTDYAQVPEYKQDFRIGPCCGTCVGGYTRFGVEFVLMRVTSNSYND